MLPEPVLNEIEKLKAFPTYSYIWDDLSSEISSGQVELKKIYYPSAEATEYAQLISMSNPKRIGKGEAAAIVLAKSCSGTLASNNLRDIMPYVRGGHPPFVSTDAILYCFYDAGHMTVQDGCAIWNEMKSKKRMLPTCDFIEVVDRMRSVR